MPTGAILIKWGATVPGREMKALEVFGRALEISEKDLKAGRIHGHKEYFARVGETGGFQIIEGELSSLFALLDDEEHKKLLVACGTITQDFSVTVYEGGSDASTQESVQRYVGQLQELGFAS